MGDPDMKPSETEFLYNEECKTPISNDAEKT